MKNTPVQGMFGTKTNADLAALLSDGAALTPAGQGLADWLATDAARFAPTTSAAADYQANVITAQNFTPAAYLAAFVNYTAELWKLYQRNLKAIDAPAQESVKPSAHAAQLIRLRESAVNVSNLRTNTMRFVDFMREAVGTIANAPSASAETRQAANHWREHVGRAGKPPAVYMRDNPQRTAVLYAVFEAYEATGGHTPPARPLPKLATSGGVLTPLGATVAQMLQAQHRTGKLKRTPATNAFVAMTEGAGMDVGQFFAENPRMSNHLYTYSLTCLQNEMQAISGEIKALKHE